MLVEKADQFITLSKRATLKPYLARKPLPYELMSDGELLAGKNGTLIVDTESYTNYWLCAFKDTKTNKIVKLEAPFNEHKLQWIMSNYRTVGFNSIKYDLPMIWAAYRNQDTEYLQNEISWKLIQGVSLKEIGVHIPKTNHIDLIEVCPLTGSLKLYGARIHQPRLQDLPFDPSSNITEKQKDIVADYCINADLNVTHGLFDFLKDRLDLRQSMSIEYREDLMSKSDAQIAEAVITREIHKNTGHWPKRPEIASGDSFRYNVPEYIVYSNAVFKDMLERIKQAKFIINDYGGIDGPKEQIHFNKQTYTIGIGGLHSFEKNVSYKSNDLYTIYDRDVASYYPRIILNLGLYPDHIGESFLKIYKSLTDRRLAAKAAKQLAADKGLKVTINGTGGKFNDQWSRLRSPHCFIHMTLTGQLALLMLIEMVEMIGVEVISANTDGIVMWCPNDKKASLDDTIKLWERKTNFQTEETIYSAYYARDVNNYFALKPNAEVKVKGQYSEVGSTTGTQLDNNPASLICTDAIKALLGKNIPIEKTIKECTDITRFITVRNVKGGAHKEGEYLGKTVRWYYAKNCTGTINYILSGNRVPDTDGAYPCMDLPTSFPDNLDHQWYINKTNEILEDIAYKPKKQQLRFF